MVAADIILAVMNTTRGVDGDGEFAALAFGEPMDADAAMRLLTEERLEAAS